MIGVWWEGLLMGKSKKEGRKGLISAALGGKRFRVEALDD